MLRCPTKPVPRRCGGTKMFCAVSVNDSPRKITRPARGRSSPAIARSTVLLPAPEGPNRTDHGAVSAKFRSISAVSHAASLALKRCCMRILRIVADW